MGSGERLANPTASGTLPTTTNIPPRPFELPRPHCRHPSNYLPHLRRAPPTPPTRHPARNTAATSIFWSTTRKRTPPQGSEQDPATTAASPRRPASKTSRSCPHSRTPPVKTTCTTASTRARRSAATTTTEARQAAGAPGGAAWRPIGTSITVPRRLNALAGGEKRSRKAVLPRRCPHHRGTAPPARVREPSDLRRRHRQVAREV